MESFVNETLVRGLMHENPATYEYTWLVQVVWMVTLAFLAGTFGAVISGIYTWTERRMAGRIQSRIGPNRVGPAGFLQWIVDAVKLLLKEDLTPKDADPILFKIAPYFVFLGFVMTFVALPFSASFVAADLNVGIFYILAITALVVVGVLMSGWASNSKWALFGGIRSAAQVVSYEIPAGLSLLVPVMMAGTLSTQGLIQFQGGPQDGAWWQVGGWFWNWTAFANPMAFVAFFIFFIASLAEGNRTPFDLPEAESELVAGFFTEYSGMRFAVFTLVEFGNIWVMSALAVILFLGGWEIPGVSHAQIAASPWYGYSLISGGIFVLKTLLMSLVVMWIRWTLPRIRVDQMMNICWKYLVPISMVLVVLTAANELLMAWASPLVLSLLHIVFFAMAGLLPAVLFFKQTFKNIRLMGDRVDLSNW